MRDDENRLPCENLKKWKKKRKKERDDKEGKIFERENKEITNKNKWKYEEESNKMRRVWINSKEEEKKKVKNGMQY